MYMHPRLGYRGLCGYIRYTVTEGMSPLACSALKFNNIEVQARIQRLKLQTSIVCTLPLDK